MKTPPMRDSTQEQPPHLVFFFQSTSLNLPRLLHDTPSPSFSSSSSCLPLATASHKKPSASTRRVWEKVRHSPVCSSLCECTCMSARVMRSDSREMQRCGSVLCCCCFFLHLAAFSLVATKPFSPCGELSRINPLTLKKLLGL